MDDTAKFILLDFLQGQDADSIQAGMLSALPDEFDKSEGGIVWDLTYPVALEKARAAQYLIPEALRAMFPRFARGEMLDMHAENRGMARKSATYAECVLRFTGADGARCLSALRPAPWLPRNRRRLRLSRWPRAWYRREAAKSAPARAWPVRAETRRRAAYVGWTSR